VGMKQNSGSSRRVTVIQIGRDQLVEPMSPSLQASL
jgi:hypothetical protein